MYLEHYGLKKNPFQITPDTDFLFLSRSHARAKAYMSYSIWKWDGFSVVTGEPGTGKTLIVRNLLARLPEEVTAVYINHTRLSGKEFLRSFAAHLGISAFSAEKAELITRISDYLNQQADQGRQVLVVLDEAHYLKPAVMEEIRFLSAIERSGKPLLNVIMVGDAGLLEKFDEPHMEQLRQRVRLWYSISKLDKEAVKEYINYRLAVSGRRKEGIFTDSAISLIHSFTDGTPRLINILCDAALVAAYVSDEDFVSTAHVRTALEELQWDKFNGKNVLEHKISHSASTLTDESNEKKIPPRLRISNQGLLMAEFILDRDSLSIGRADTNDIMLDDPFVCDFHAVIHKVNDKYVIEDLDSLNGTYVNARKIKARALEDGDIIGISSYQIKVDFSHGRDKTGRGLPVDDNGSESEITTLLDTGRMAI